jgi:hypothetical protein
LFSQRHHRYKTQPTFLKYRRLSLAPWHASS